MWDDTGGFAFRQRGNGWTVGRFAALSVNWLTHLVTTREGPDLRADIAGAAALLADQLDLAGVAWLSQVHGPVVLPARPAKATP